MSVSTSPLDDTTLAGRLQAPGAAGVRVRGHRREVPRLMSLVALDALAFMVGLRIAISVYERSFADDATYVPPLRSGLTALGPDATVAALTLLQLVVLAGSFFFAKLYHQGRAVSRVDLTLGMFRAVSVGIILTFALAGLVIPDLDYVRRVPVYDWLFTFLVALSARLVHRALWSAVWRAGIGRLRVLVVGAGATAQDLVARIQRLPHLGYEVVGVVDDTPGRTRLRGIPVVGRTTDLGVLVERLEADEVLLALPHASHDVLLGLVSQCRHDGVTIKVFPDVFQILAHEIQLSDIDGLPLLAVRDVALAGWRRSLKRGLDLAIALPLLVLSSPLLLLLAILVKLDSPGPAFYVQERVGLDGRPFPCLKLRSMRLDAERDTGAVWAMRDDPRRTRSGRFLRRTNLDEWPQFINVLLGHMSVVGPRPERPEFVREFEKAIPRYMERHREKAGITGWAQVNGLRGRTSIEERTKYDLYYIENWSILLDLKILARTLVMAFKDPNAY